jgi:hypothetical protein
VQALQRWAVETKLVEQVVAVVTRKAPDARADESRGVGDAINFGKIWKAQVTKYVTVGRRIDNAYEASVKLEIVVIDRLPDPTWRGLPKKADANIEHGPVDQDRTVQGASIIF